MTWAEIRLGVRAPELLPTDKMLDEILEFLSIDELERDRAKQLWRLIAPQIDSLFERFYRDLESSPAGTLLASANMGRLHSKQIEHWARVFASDFGDDYRRSVRRVGMQHRDIGLEPEWFIASYTAVKLQFIQAIIQSERSPVEKGHLIRTLEKYIAIDMGLALSAYSAVTV